jgi:ketol-acid reductoisomerase
VRQVLQQQLQRVRDGTFAREFRRDYEKRFEWFNSQQRRLADHPIEAAGAAIRSLMPWLGDPHKHRPT